MRQIATIHLSHRSKFIEVNKDLHLSTHRAEVRHLGHPPHMSRVVSSYTCKAHAAIKMQSLSLFIITNPPPPVRQ
jgi:hypothetical protein